MSASTTSATLRNRTAMLVDRHPIWMEAVAVVLQRAGVEVVARATSSISAIERLEETDPELLITEIAPARGDLDGVTLVRRARERRPELRIVVLSVHEDREHMEAAFAAGADAYVIKTAHPEDLTSAIRQVFEPSVYLATGQARNGASPTPPSDEAPLTRRELEILRLVAVGHSNAQLARMLWVTEQTVKFHLSNIYRKLEVANRTEASRWAQLRGLLPTSGDVPDSVVSTPV